MLPSELTRVALSFYEELNTPLSLSLALQLKAGDWEGIARVSVDPSCYLDAESYARDAAAAGFLKKLSELPSKIDTVVAAHQKWWEGERDCFKSNERLCRYLERFSNASDREDGISCFFQEVQKLIADWIGHSPPDLTIGRFGPGATYSDRGKMTTIPHKISSTASLTRDAIWHLPQWLGTKWGAFQAQHHGELSFVHGNRFATVPKTALIDRPIAVEPSINVFFQLGYGREIRNRLREKKGPILNGRRVEKAGWDLDRAQEIHRQVAEASSKTLEYSTLDLSNASDTVCSNLVELLLPPRWFSVLDDLRSKRTFIDGKWVRLEKFSSMGNGFTFELETLIFLALATVACRKAGEVGEPGYDVFVFGDDIIVPRGATRTVISLLQFCGFSLNASKTFTGLSPFRESCGADYFDGKPVRPYYLKEIPNGPQELIAIANGISALYRRLTACGFAGNRRAWFSVLDSLPSRVRMCRGPEALGDLVIHDKEPYWTIRERNCIRYLRVFRPHKVAIVKYRLFEPEVVLACATYGCGNRQEGVIPRDGVRSYKVGWHPYS
jgi:hypothetical protein